MIIIPTTPLLRRHFDIAALTQQKIPVVAMGPADAKLIIRRS
ncbi:MAG: hypothetical protein PHV34_23835 [Verrucomicrobiae bacterium]|nr:hypothetical protein [Verrucomicrobiae bacterium]